MLSSKRLAQLGLGSAGFVLFASVAALLAGSSDLPTAGAREGASVDNQPVAMVTEPIATVSTATLTPPATANGH